MKGDLGSSLCKGPQPAPDLLGCPIPKYSAQQDPETLLGGDKTSTLNKDLVTSVQEVSLSIPKGGPHSVFPTFPHLTPTSHPIPPGHPTSGPIHQPS